MSSTEANAPSTKKATQRLSNALKERSDDDLAALVVDLHNNNDL